MRGLTLQKVTQVVIILFLLIAGLIYAKPFLVPFIIASLLAMLFLPLTVWLERKGVHRVLSIIIALLILVGFTAGVIYLISWQVSDLAKNSSEIEKNVTEKIQQLQQFVNSSLGITPDKQKEMIQGEQGTSSGKVGGFITATLSGVGGFLTNYIIVLVYIFLFIYYRSHLKKFILKMVAKGDEAKTNKIINDSSKIAQKYLTGLALMIFTLWVMYGIGFSLVGVKNAIFFAILCGLLEIVPFVGNLLGTGITILTSVAQGGDLSLVIGIIIVYGIIQFIQTYLLEPLVVGAEVNIHPLATIVGLVVGELIWGIPGMILAIPLLGVAKIVCDNIDDLKPIGYLIGEEKKKGEKNLGQKIKGWFGKK